MQMLHFSQETNFEADANARDGGKRNPRLVLSSKIQRAQEWLCEMSVYLNLGVWFYKFSPLCLQCCLKEEGKKEFRS